MKCSVCEQEFYYETLKQLLTLQQICNICIDLFIYRRKNVKMNGVKIEIFYLANYEYLIEFENRKKRLLFNRYLIKKHKLLSTHSEFCRQKQLSFYYYHSNLYDNLREVLKQINVNKRYKIRLFELLM